MSRKIRDYSHKNFSNPMFERRQQASARTSRARRIVGMIVSLVLLIAASWFFLFSRFFVLTDIRVSGNDRVATWDIQDAVKQLMSERFLHILPKSNVLLLSENELRERLIGQFVFATVDITKRPPHGLDITVKERVSSILLKTSDGTRDVLDLDGTVLRLYLANEPDPDAYLLQHQVILDSQDTFMLRNQPVDGHTVLAAIAAPDAMTQAFPTGPSLKEMHIDKKGSHTLRLVTSEGWSIYTDTNQTIPAQLQDAVLVLQQKIGKDRNRLDYIDVRFGDKVFFKLR